MSASRDQDPFLATLEAIAPGVVGSPYVPHFPHPKQLGFLALTCREALYGGAAGGGKSDALLMAALQYVNVPGYSALLMRRTYPELSEAGGLIPRSKDWLRGTDASWNEGRKQWTFPSGALLSFRHIQRVDDVPDRGPEYQFIGYDELTTFSEPMYRRMFSRLRKPSAGALSQVPLRIRGGTNPGGEGHEWVKRRFLIEGPGTGRAFVPARVDDNPSVDREAYVAALREGLDAVSLARMLEGDWEIVDGGQVFSRGAFRVVDFAPAQGRRVRAWDLAGTTGPTSAWTVGVRMLSADGQWWVEDVVRFRARPGDRDAKILETAQRDGHAVEIVLEQEPADAGIKQADDQVRMLAGYNVRAVRPTGPKEVRASPLARQVEAGNVALVSGPWVGPFLDEAQVFPESAFADQVDAASMAFAALTGFAGVRAATHVGDAENRRSRDTGRLFRPAGRVRLRPE